MQLASLMNFLSQQVANKYPSVQQALKCKCFFSWLSWRLTQLGYLSMIPVWGSQEQHMKE